MPVRAGARYMIPLRQPKQSPKLWHLQTKHAGGPPATQRKVHPLDETLNSTIAYARLIS
jgi:hypothetical protein